MATTFKQFLNNDVTTTRTLLHESIPITGSILSGTYNEGGQPTETNIKNYSHGLFQSVFDYPFLSSSANHIFDITVGYAPSSSLNSTSNTQNSDKLNIYNQMAQVLVGHETNGTIREFDQDGDFAAGGPKLREVFFLNFARLLNKDEIKKGTFSLELGISGSTPATRNTATFDGQNFAKRIKIQDTSGSSGYLVNSPAGEYGVLFATGSNDAQGQVTNLAAATDAGIPCGLIFYQAGIAVVSGSVFNSAAFSTTAPLGVLNTAATVGTVELKNPTNVLAAASGFNFISGSSISGSCDAIRNRIFNVSFNNTTELNSTIYFCRASHNEFNYSSNPTYLSSSQIRVKETSLDQPVSYITTVGLYSAANELLAVAKVSEPLKKSPDNELTLRVRLDY